MTSALTPVDPAAEEAASLYVLDLLAPEERRDFEHRLDRDPALRGLVREFQGNLDALVLANPSRPAPLQVWGHIAAEVKAQEARVIRFPAQVPGWMKQLLAAAACLALGAWLHAWLNPPPEPPPLAIREQPPGPSDNPPVAPQPPPSTPPTVATPPPAPRISPPPSLVAPATSAEVEAARLRERVQILASQVAALNQVLTQHVTLPSGVTRLHVFRLTNANVPEAANIPEANGPEAQRNLVEAEPLPDALAALAARRHLLPNAPPATSPAPTESLPDALAALAARQSTRLPTTTETPVSDAVAPETPGNLTIATSTALNNGQPLGFYDPETGHGAIALFNENPTPDFAYAVWSRTTGVDGSPVIQNVGVKSAANPATVISFSNSGNSPGSISFSNSGSPAGSSTTPTFFITLEPFDGFNISSTPTGPIVAAPPTTP